MPNSKYAPITRNYGNRSANQRRGGGGGGGLDSGTCYLICWDLGGGLNGISESSTRHVVSTNHCKWIG